MATFKLYIRTDNDAFAPDPVPELARLLRQIADKVERGGNDIHWYQTILDVNGNDVGRFALKERE